MAIAMPYPVIDAAAVRRLTPMPKLIAALRRAFRGGGVAPVRQAYVMSSDATLLLMPAWMPGADIGVKIATIRTDQSPAVRASYLLIDGASGLPKAMLDGSMLTARRTAAASALASACLSRPDSRMLLVVGTGTLVAHLIEAHASVRPIDRVLVWGRNPARADAATAAARAAGHAAETVTDLPAALRRADIVTVATLATVPIIRGAALPPGIHVDLIGAFRPNMAEADPESFRRARVFVDTREGTLSEAGDLMQAIAAGAMTAAGIEAELGDLCMFRPGGHAGRGDDAAAITLFKSVGTSLEDLAAAGMVLDGWATDHA